MAKSSPPKRSGELAVAVYAGSFDPVTNGHIDIIRRSLVAFDKVIVAVAMRTSDPNKDQGGLFTPSERVELISEALKDVADRVVAESFTGLLVDYCEQKQARAIVRGLRAVADFEYEFQMAMMNRHLKAHIETFFLATGQAHSYTSSRLVKEVASLGGDIRGLVPENVHRRLMQKFGRSA